MCPAVEEHLRSHWLAPALAQASVAVDSVILPPTNAAPPVSKVEEQAPMTLDAIALLIVIALLTPAIPLTLISVFHLAVLHPT